jgi:hypothetical protein
VLYDINSTCDLLEVASFEGWEGTKAGVLSKDVALSIGLKPSNSACQKISNQIIIFIYYNKYIIHSPNKQVIPENIIPPTEEISAIWSREKQIIFW